MLSELQRKRVWEAWLSSEIRANYFADLSGRYRRAQCRATWVTLVASSGAFATLLAKLPEEYWWLPPVLALLTAAVSLYSLVVQNQQQAIDSADLHHRLNRLAAEYRALWDDMYAENAALRLAALDEKAAELSKSATAFPAHERLLLKWEDYVVRHHTAKAAA